MICCQHKQSLIIYSCILKCLHNLSNVAINILMETHAAEYSIIIVQYVT